MANFFQYKSYWVKWMDKSPANRASLCDRCGKRVERDEHRLCVDNGEGPQRRRGKGKNHQYICVLCAQDVPNDLNENIQGSFFDE